MLGPSISVSFLLEKFMLAQQIVRNQGSNSRRRGAGLFRDARRLAHRGPCKCVWGDAVVLVAGVDLGICPELGVGPKHQVGAGAGPPDFARRAIPALEQVPGVVNRLRAMSPFVPKRT